VLRCLDIVHRIRFQNTCIVSEDWKTKTLHPLQPRAKEWITEQGQAVCCVQSKELVGWVGTLYVWGYYASGTGLEMSGCGSSTVMTLKGDPTEILEPNNFANLFNLKFLQNYYSAVQPLGQHSLFSSAYLTYVYAGLSTYLHSNLCFHIMLSMYC